LTDGWIAIKNVSLTIGALGFVTERHLCIPRGEEDA
jgi:hypothetical protein